MKKAFPGYYSLSPQERGQLSRRAIFTFDANVLLNIYRLREQARLSFLGLLRQLSEGDRFWLSHQAALEYHRTRPLKIREQLQPSRDIKKALSTALKSVGKSLEQFEDHPFLDADRVIERISKLESGVRMELDAEEKTYLKQLTADAIRDELDQISKNSVGPPYTDERLKKIYSDGKERYRLSVPPGFGDSKTHGGDKDEPECYGDLIIWNQILDHSKKTKRPVVLVTEDRTKGDWYWLLEPGNRDSRLLGPHPLLVEEMLRETGKRFHLCRTARFTEWMSKYFGRKVSASVVEEIDEVSKSVPSSLGSAYADMVFRQMQDLRNAVRHAGGVESLTESIRQQQQQLEDIVRTVRGHDLGKAIEDISRSLGYFSRTAFSPPPQTSRDQPVNEHDAPRQCRNETETDAAETENPQGGAEQ